MGVTALSTLVTSTAQTVDLLRELRSGTPRGAELGEAFEELRALVIEARQPACWEHEKSTSGVPMPLFEHLVDRALDRKLRGLEDGRIDVFQKDDALGAEAFADLVALTANLDACGLLPVVRAALLFLDFAKGGTDEQRRRWEAMGVDLSVHNEAAAEILSQAWTLERFEYFTSRPLFAELARQMVRVHGFAGQWVRGETPLRAYGAWVAWLRDNAAALADALGRSEADAVEIASDCLHLVDVCDTAAVREGLVDDHLYRALRSVRDHLATAVKTGALSDAVGVSERFRRLRSIALGRGEPVERLDAALADLGPEGAAWFDAQLANAQLWYFEPATWALSSSSALKLLVAALAHADAADTVDTTKLFHVTFQPLVDELGEPSRRNRYRVRLVDALLHDTPMDGLRRGEVPQNLLATFFPRIGRSTAVAMELDTSDEADALVTLLAIYEGRSSVAFHQILKLLCDAYELRKDEFDRLANEEQYLETMNAARSDKERMLDFVRPGTIVEIGPGGGVVLDLLEDRFTESDIVGLDLSQLAVDELLRRRQAENRQWRVVLGDAFELPELFGRETVDTVVFCSVLHEIYSYVAHEGRQFRLESVRDMLRAAYRALVPGGRILIRDGIKPPDGTRIIEFIDPDGPDFLRRFVDEFEGRAIRVTWLDSTRARMSTADAMEFLYCYTWGPASFPYEVRELYGVMERDEYDRNVLAWLSDFEDPPAVVEVPADLRSYLQPGYISGLAPKIRLLDESGAETALPDSNALMVYKKTPRTA